MGPMAAPRRGGGRDPVPGRVCRFQRETWRVERLRGAPAELLNENRADADTEQEAERTEALGQSGYWRGGAYVSSRLTSSLQGRAGGAQRSRGDGLKGGPVAGKVLGCESGSPDGALCALWGLQACPRAEGERGLCGAGRAWFPRRASELRGAEWRGARGEQGARSARMWCSRELMSVLACLPLGVGGGRSSRRFIAVA